MKNKNIYIGLFLFAAIAGIILLQFQEIWESLETQYEVYVSVPMHYASPAQGYKMQSTTTRVGQNHLQTTLKPRFTLAKNATVVNNVSPITHMSSSAQVQTVGSSMQTTSMPLQTQSSTTQKGIYATSGVQVWMGNITPVASANIAYVEASSGALPAQMFASGRRNAPPDEEGGGTQGPDIEHQTPLLDGLWCMLLFGIIYLLVHKYKFNHE